MIKKFWSVSVDMFLLQVPAFVTLLIFLFHFLYPVSECAFHPMTALTPMTATPPTVSLVLKILSVMIPWIRSVMRH